MIRIALIAALPGELAPLVRGWKKDRIAGVARWRRTVHDLQFTATCAGVGPGPAARAFAAASADGPLRRVISLGWAGALRPDFAAGVAYPVAAVVDHATGERFLTAQAGCTLVTTERVVSAEEKRALAESGADLVDMEAAVIARLALRSGVGFACVKGVSDALGDVLPDFNAFLTPDGQLQLGRFVAFAALKPALWPGLLRLGRQSRQAAESLKTLADGLLGRPSNPPRPPDPNPPPA